MVVLIDGVYKDISPTGYPSEATDLMTGERFRFDCLTNEWEKTNDQRE